MKKKLKKINIHPFAKQIITRFIGVFLIVCIGVALFLHFTSQPAVAEWFDSNWSFRQRVNIPSHTTLETNVYVTVPSFDATDTSKFQPDCGDLRFTKQNGQLLKYYVVDCDATANIHVFFDSLPAGETNYYMYYGNPSANNGFESADFTTVATGLGSQTAAAEEIGTGPIVHWSMDEGQGQTVNDGTTNNLDGTLGNTSSAASDDPTWQTEDQCISGKCLLFDGTDDAVDLSDNSKLDTFSGGISISSWVNPKEIAGYNREVVSKKSDIENTGYRFRVIQNGAIRLSFGDGTSTHDNTSTSTGLVPLNQWTHIEVTYDYQHVTFYVNGKQIEQIAQTNPIANNTGELIIGAYQNKSTYWFNGYLDEVKIYPYARSAAQVKTDYIKGASTTGSAAVAGKQDTAFLNNGLVGYWKMDEESWTNDCSTDTVLDSSGNGNNGDACPNSTGPVGGALGKFGNAGLFDGSNDYVTMGDLSSELGSLAQGSVSLWFKRDATSINKALFYWGDSGTNDNLFRILFSSSNTLQILLKTTNDLYRATIDLGSTTSNGTWNHIVFTVGPRGNSLYYNGALQTLTYTAGSSSSTEWFDDISSEDVLSIGSSRIVTPEYYYGHLDEIRIYNRALSDQEVRNLYNWAPGPVGYWKFDDNTGMSAVDSSGNGYTGTLDPDMNERDWVQGKFGNALDFDGSDDTVTNATTTLFNNANAFTISAWINPRTCGGSGDGTFFTKANEVIFYICQSTNNLAIFDEFATYAESTNNSITMNTWQYVSGVHDGAGNFTFYVNGINVTSDSTAAMTNGSGSIYIGSSNNDLYNFNGKIDEVKIYNYARSQGQIIEDMNGGHPIGGSPVGSQIIYWKFDEQQGSTANNSIGTQSSLAGSISGGVWNTNATCKIGGCIELDGSSDYVSAGDVSFVDNLSQLTISMWINPSSLATARDILNKVNTNQTAFQLIENHANSDELSFYVCNALTSCSQREETTNFDLTVGEWAHLTVVYNGSLTGAGSGRIKFYKNGKRVNDLDTGYATGSVIPASSTSNLKLGAADFNPNSFRGKIDELKIYATALTDDQVLIDYNAGASLNFGTGTASESAQLTGGPGNPPILHWNLDENTGTSTVADKSGNARTGTLNNITQTSWSPGKLGNSLFFSGAASSQQRISIADAAFLTPTSLSISVWFKIDRLSSELGSPQTMLEHDHSANPFEAYSVSIDTDDRLYFKTCRQADTTCSNSSTGVTLSKNRWYHFLGTFDGTTKKIYLDGVLRSSPAFSGSLRDGDSTFTVGTGDSGFGGAFRGNVDEVKLFDYALTQTQVSYDFNRGAPLGWWKFDECQGTTVYDSSGNGNNGTWNGTGSGSQTAVGTCTTSSTAWGNGATGKFGSSINLDGTNDYISFGDPSSGIFDFAANNDFSFSLWVNFTDNAAVQGIFGKSNGSLGTSGNTGFDLIYRGDTDKGIYFRINDGTTTAVASQYTSTNLGDSTWHHIAVTADRDGNSTLYIDGIAKDADSISGESGSLATSTNLVSGRRADSNNSWHFSGKLDDVRLYNYPLSSTQIKIIMNEGSSVRFSQ